MPRVENKTEHFHHNMKKGAKKGTLAGIKSQKRHYLPTNNIKM